MKINIELPRIKKSKEKRKVLRIRNSEFLYRIHEDRIETTGHISHAMDLNELDWATISNILHNLYNAGYRECKVMEVR